MTTFNIVTFKGESNLITRFGKNYLALPDHSDPQKSVIYCELKPDNTFNLSLSGICFERNRDLRHFGTIDIGYISELKNELTIQ